MRSWIIGLLAAALMSVTMPLSAGAEEKPAQQTEPKSGEQSITGCVSAGTDAGSFVVKTDNGDQVMITGAGDLQKYIGQRVTALGRMNTKDGKKLFHVTKVDQIAGSCSS